MTGPVATNSQAKAPDGGWGWVVVFASFMIHVLADGLTYSWGIFQVALVDDFKCGEGPASWIPSILVGVTLCSGPLTSALVNRYNCRTVTIAGALLASGGLALSTLAPNLISLYISVGIITGLGLGLMYLPAIVSVTCYFEKYRSMATGIAVCGTGFGMFLMSPFLGFFIDRFEWRATILLAGGLMLSCVGFGALFRPLEISEEDLEGGGSELKPLEAKTKEEPQSNGQPPQISLNGKPPTSPTSNGTSEGDSPTQNGPKRPHSIHGAQGIMDNMASPTVSDKARLALSQPYLSQAPEPPKKLAFGSGIMYRKDVLYGGSLANLQHHNRSTSHVDNRHHHHGSRHLSHSGEEKPLMRDRRKSSRLDDRPRFCGIPCAPETADTLREMLDFSLLLDPIFILYVISNFLTSIGFNVPYVYIVKFASERGVERESANWLLSAIGLANTFGKAFLGYIADKPWVNRLYMYNISLTICGLSCVACTQCTSFTSFAIVSALFGLSCGAYVGLTAVVLVDLLGLDKLTNAFGLLLLFQGFASLIGPPITGGLYDYFQSFDIGFVFSGIMVSASGLMLFVIPPLQGLIERRSTKIGVSGSNCDASPPVAVNAS